MSEQETMVVEREFIVGTPPGTVVDEFNKFWHRLPEIERQRLLHGTFEPVKPVGPTGHIAIRPTSPRLDPMTGGPLPSREAELGWLSGFQYATCMPSRSRFLKPRKLGSPYHPDLFY